MRLLVWMNCDCNAVKMLLKFVGNSIVTVHSLLLMLLTQKGGQYLDNTLQVAGWIIVKLVIIKLLWSSVKEIISITYLKKWPFYKRQ